MNNVKTVSEVNSQAFFAHFFNFMTLKGEVDQSASKYFEAMDTQFTLFEYKDKQIYFTSKKYDRRVLMDAIRLLALIKPTNGKFVQFDYTAFALGGADTTFKVLNTNTIAIQLSAEQFKTSKLVELTAEELKNLITSATTLKELKLVTASPVLSEDDNVTYLAMIDEETKFEAKITGLIDMDIARDRSHAIAILSMPKLA